ncbi:hypothetical protein FEM03_09375 [Phragmitibacter flavus]|uniref:Uncharacterized protein n=1 Tax=Phragmitibacter flavus TaxID=2576071 RepID=A0A5R8KFM7_9BACT|nr:hypothetical protein [Phragmitibacter flavus]TLD71114.1 hypothetical protein FEM03_09375 [Phragmitibacter flavus]
MRPVSSLVLTFLLIALCGLCGVQWWRENELRRIAEKQRDDLVRHEAVQMEQDARIKSADAEILRLTGSIADLRTNSVSKLEFDELKTAAEGHVATINRQNEIIVQQNESITKQNEALEKFNAAMLQANETIKTLTTQRDDLAKRINEVTEQYNKLANPGAAAAPAPAPPAGN